MRSQTEGVVASYPADCFYTQKPASSHPVPNRTLFDICGSALRIAVVLVFARSARRFCEAGELLG